MFGIEFKKVDVIIQILTINQNSEHLQKIKIPGLIYIIYNSSPLE